MFLGLIAYLIVQPPAGLGNRGASASSQGGSPLDIGRALFTTYLLPFEVTCVLILIAILGAIVLARKEID